jgi:hypothetical protein
VHLRAAPQCMCVHIRAAPQTHGSAGHKPTHTRTAGRTRCLYPHMHCLYPHTRCVYPHTQTVPLPTHALPLPTHAPPTHALPHTECLKQSVRCLYCRPRGCRTRIRVRGPPSRLLSLSSSSGFTLSRRLAPRWSMQCMCVHAREASAPADAPRLARSIRRAQARAAADARRRGRACPCSAGEMEHETRGDVRA